MYTGLRGCDISALTLDSFDWEHDLIKITQAKTGQPLTLPLRAVVGNAVFDYLLKERPRSPEPYVFLQYRCHTEGFIQAISMLYAQKSCAKQE